MIKQCTCNNGKQFCCEFCTARNIREFNETRTPFEDKISQWSMELSSIVSKIKLLQTERKKIDSRIRVAVWQKNRRDEGEI